MGSTAVVGGRGVVGGPAVAGGSAVRAGAAVRLTRRGRLALIMLAMAVMVMAGMVFGHGSSQAASPGGTIPRSVTVQPGQSLWSVAATIAPHQDPRLVVAKLESMNNLANGQVLAGQRLLIPSFG